LTFGLEKKTIKFIERILKLLEDIQNKPLISAYVDSSGFLIYMEQEECPNPLASLLFTNAKNAAEAE